MPTPSPEMGGYRAQEAPRKAERPAFEHPETIEGGSERNEIQQPSQAADPVVIPQIPSPVLQDVTIPTATQPIMNNAPLAAADEDLIEKEWVDKAKKIVLETKSDPYKQEDEVSKLQADYIKKRYGKDVKLSSS